MLANLQWITGNYDCFFNNVFVNLPGMKGKLLTLFLFCAVSLMAVPPPVPSAGVVEREIEKEYDGRPLEPEKEVPAIQIDIPEERLEIPDGKKLVVQNVEIQGNEAIPTWEILSWIEGYIGCELSLKEVYELCQLIDQNYAKKGYFLARAYPPAQTIEDDTLVIEILEGKLGNVKVEGNQYYWTSFIESYFRGLQGKPLQYDAFLRALMLLNDNTDLSVGAVFEKGEEFGYADVILVVKDKRPIHLYLNGNNYGRNLTTDVRVGGRLDWGNFFTQGDTLAVTEVVGFPVDALYFTNVSYLVPVNRAGTFVEGSYLFSKFRIKELTSLRLKGRSSIGTLKVSHAAVRRRNLNVDFFSYFDYKQIRNFVLTKTASFDKLRVLTAGFLIDHFNPSKGRDYLVLRAAAGIPNFLGGMKAVDNNSSRIGGGGRFFLFSADYDRIQYLGRDCFFYFHGTGQLSPSKLTQPEQIYIGGIGTVRGFPLATGLGDSGYYLNFEFRLPPPVIKNKRVFKRWDKTWKEVVQFDAFLDHGGTFLQSLGNTFLWGTGLGVRVFGPYSLTLSVDVGFPLNHRDDNRKVFTYVKLTCEPF